MSYVPRDIALLLDKIRYDCTAIQAKVSELKTAVASMNIPEDVGGFPCPECGIRKSSEASLADHRANVHGIVSVA